jgi:hypothetical protein
MLIKFLNANPEHSFKPLYIDSDWIVSVYTEGDDSTTFIYGGPNGTIWEVKEDLETVRKLVNRAKNGGNVS